MCLIAVAWRATADFPLILAANRDEFHDRPSAPANWWPHAPHVLGGLDLRAGGSWLALDRTGRLAAVTNIRGPQRQGSDVRSRGHLVGDFLTRDQQTTGYLEVLRRQVDSYSPFNLLLADQNRLAYIASGVQTAEQLAPGVYGLSNAALDTPWPKVSNLKEALGRAICRADPLPELFAALADSEPAEDHLLPDSGVELDWERRLSAPFIRSEQYGTRCSTVILQRADGEVRFAERRFNSAGEHVGGSEFTFRLA